MKTTTFAARDWQGHIWISASVPHSLIESLDMTLRAIRLGRGNSGTSIGDDWHVIARGSADEEGGYSYLMTALYRRGPEPLVLPGLEIRLVQTDAAPGEPPLILRSHMRRFGLAWFREVPDGIFRAECGIEKLKDLCFPPG